MGTWTKKKSRVPGIVLAPLQMRSIEQMDKWKCRQLVFRGGGGGLCCKEKELLVEGAPVLLLNGLCAPLPQARILELEGRQST